jgi:integrase
MPLELIAPGQRKGNKHYIARGSLDGHGRIERSLKTSNRKLAQQRLRQLERELEDAAALGGRISFARAALAYMEDRKAKLAERGLEYHHTSEARYMARLLTHWGNTPLDELTPPVIAEAARALYPKAQPATRHRQAVTPTRAVIGHHERGGLRKGVQDNARVRWLTPEEAETLIEAACPRARRLILTLLGTGLRTSEVVRMQVRNINVPTAQVWIGNTKNDDPRWTPIERARALPALLEGLPPQGAAFLTPKGQPYAINRGNSGGQFAVIFNKAREAAGLGDDVTPHVLRHTFATWYYAASGHNLVALMQAGGWRKVDMALRYTKLAPSDLADRLLAHGWNFAAGGKLGENREGGNIIAINSKR